MGSNMLTQISQKNNSTMVLVTASPELSRNKVSLHSGEVTWLTSSVISQHRLLTLHARTSTRRHFAPTTQRLSQLSSSLVTWPPVVPLVLRLFASTHLISQEPDSQPM